MVFQLSPFIGEGWLQTADREIRQAKMLADAAGESPRVNSADGSSSSDLIRLTKAHGVELADDSTSGEPISLAWSERGLSVTLILASYNYRPYLQEAIDSALSQSYTPDEILFSDDDSTDGSRELLEEFSSTHPDLVRLNLNKENLGIERHFNVAISKTSGDLIVFLGADNRFPPHYVEACVAALVRSPSAAIAYTDYAMFGSRAKSIYESMHPDFQGAHFEPDIYLSDFPNYDNDSKTMLFDGNNFIHGSSMYRRAAFDSVGGYGTRDNGPEDWDLFRRMLDGGWSAVKAREALLEYRQHSSDQANMQFSYFWELGKLREDIPALKGTIADLEEKIVDLRHEISAGARERTLLQTERDQLRDFVNRIRSFPLFRAALALRARIRKNPRTRK